jgi:hypothetical protein
MGIKVNQFDSEGKLIATYSSYSEAAKILGCNESTIRKATKFIPMKCEYTEQNLKNIYNHKKVFGKFYFVNDDDSIVVSQMGGMYEIGQPSNLNEQPEIIEVKGNLLPKILFLDCENSPTRAYCWGLWKQNINLSQIISNWYMISWAGKWLGEDEVFSDVLTPQEAIEEDDNRIMGNLWEILDQADIIVAHNGDAFDIPKINTRFVLHGLMPPSPYRTIDTLTIARQRFGFTSNKLDYLAKFFGYKGKIATDFKLWEECMIGNKEALKYMDIYCKQDITTLEQVFHKLKIYAKGLPNLDLYQDSTQPVCPTCGINHLRVIPDKFFYTQATKYQVYRCSDCGGLARAKTGVKFENKKQVSAIPR